MKILQLTTTLGIGGAEKFCVELSNELSVNHEVIICTIKPDQGWHNRKLINDQVTYCNIGVSNKYDYRIIQKLIRIIKTDKPDIVHFHSSFIFFYLVFAKLFIRNIIFMQTVHSTLTAGYRKQLDKVSILMPKLYNVTISNDIYSIMISHYPKLNFHNIDNGIKGMITTDSLETVKKEIDDLKKTNTAKVFTAIGNYSNMKNFTLLAEVFNDLSNKDIVLLIIGYDKDPRKSNYNKVKNLKAENTYLLGNKGNVADYLYHSHCLISSSLMEGMPLIILEAFSLGVPVVATPAGGIIDMVIDEENGYIAKGFGKEGLREAVNRFLDASPEEIERIKENNIKRFREKYSIERCAAKYELLYKEILASNKTNKTN